MKFKCLIIDDEPPAHKVLESYISKHSSLDLVGNFYNAIEALSFLSSNQVDLLFLDINMPELSGVEMLRTMQNPPLVILTTAYSEFALESYDLGVIDYLMKPIRFDRFLKAVNKVMALKQTSPQKQAQKPDQKQSIFIKVDGVQQKIVLADLEYVESQGNFVQLYVQDKKYLTAETLTNMDKNLKDSGFLRIHKSYVINLEKVSSLQGNMVQVGNKLLPVGNSYRQVVLGKLGM